MLRTSWVMSLTFKWTILVTDALFCFKINLITMTDRSMKIKSLVWLWTLCSGWICKWFFKALRFRWHSRYIWVKKLKIIIIKFYKIVKILRAPWLVKKQSLIAPVNLWKIEVYICYLSNRPHFRSVYQRSKHLQMLGNHSKKSRSIVSSSFSQRGLYRQ